MAMALLFIYSYRDQLHGPLMGLIHKSKLPRLAEQLGLKYTNYGYEGGTTLTGQYRAIPVNIYEELRGPAFYGGRRVRRSVFFRNGPLARHERRHTVYEIKLQRAAVPDELFIFPENLKAKIGQLLHREDIQIGIPELDKAFTIQGTFTEDAREFFARPDVARYFMELRTLCKSFRLENNCLIFEFRNGIALQHDKLRTQLETLTRCAHAIQQTDPFDTITSRPDPRTLPTSRPVPEAIPLYDPTEPTTNTPSSPPDGHW